MTGTNGAARVTVLDEARSATRAKLQQALDTAHADRSLPTAPALSAVLPGGALRAGSSYSVQGSTALAMLMMAGPSDHGAWCGAVGLPAFGAEAAAGLGVALDRLVLVPSPGQEWLGVVATLLDVLTVVVVQPPREVTAAEASRLSARMRDRGAVLVAIGSWPGSAARLQAGEQLWSGLGEGFGHLTAREITVTVTGRRTATRPRQHRLWLPDATGTVRSAERAPVVESVPAWQREAVG
ncbi:MAG TPA: hypothetical protein VFB74_26300 [Kribbellaceae bacterium]|nr:hypothetical protein [Kribbellaceae bacterium]